LSYWLYLAGDAELELDHHEQAIEHFRHAISLNPTQLPSFVGMAATHALSGNLSEAQAWISELVKLAPHWSRETLLERFGGTKGARPSRVSEGMRLALSAPPVAP
jgi:tetratricopeptide (TPR) repeat protein